MLIAGKTPTTMYPALQHGMFVANQTLTEEDLESSELPKPLRRLEARCFGITTTSGRLSSVRRERSPGSRYASLEQCKNELRRAGLSTRPTASPSSTPPNKSVEEMSAVILQTLRSTGATTRG